MSVRIYQLSKEIGMDNAELITLLKERGYEVKSASSTVDNISAESLRNEYSEKSPASDEPVLEEVSEQSPLNPESAPLPPVAPPVGAIVRSKADIERERKEREEEEAEEVRRRQEEQKAANRPPPVPVKAPPALPKGRPQVTSRPGQGGPSAPPLPQPGSPHRPIVRTDLPPAPPESPSDKPGQPKAPPIRVPGVSPQPGNAPSAGGPAPLRPPRPAGPSPLRPPMVKAPSAIAPPKAPPVPPAPKPTGEAAPDTAGDESTPVPTGEAQLRPLQVKSPIVVRDFAVQLGKRPFQLISELMELGIFASMNSSIEEPVATRIAKNHGIALEIRHRGEGPQAILEETKKTPQKIETQLEDRPPVVCILGHVDHGKTTLLDTIRKANVVAGEAGGITQHVGAYQVTHKDQKITFIDTPGHAAFSNMRARGANVTDIAVLVVAADDGFMPQTDEALGHARVAKVPVVVAINKMDAPGANPDKVYRQMQERELSPEEYGGETLSAKISAIKGEGIDALLDAILLQSEVTEGIQADPRANVEGAVLEAQKELGRGSTASVIIQQGTLKPGMALVCGEHYCRVRQLIDDKGEQIKQAGPSTPLKVVGWSSAPDAGDSFCAVKNEREAKKIAETNELERKKLEATEKQESKASVDDLFAAIARTSKRSYRALVKADVYGTAEALATSLLNIKSDKIDIEVIDMGVGAVTRNDILMASAAKAEIVAFNVGLDNGVQSFSKHHSITIIQHNIIYELINQVKDAMADLLEPEIRENKIGAAEVRQVFPLGKGFVAGCMVTEGRIQRDSVARLVRGGKIVHESKVSTLKRFKDDVGEVRAGYECGIQLDGLNSYESGDSIESFEILKIKPEL